MTLRHRRAVYVTLSPAVLGLIDSYASAEGMSRSGAIERVLRERLQPPECSICRRRHGLEVTHAAE